MQKLAHMLFVLSLLLPAGKASSFAGLPIYEAHPAKPARRVTTLLRIYDFLNVKCQNYSSVSLSIALLPDKEYYVFVVMPNNELSPDQKSDLARAISEWKKEIGRELIDEYMEGYLAGLLKEQEQVQKKLKTEQSPVRRQLLDAVMNGIIYDMKEAQDDCTGLFDIVVSESKK